MNKRTYGFDWNKQEKRETDCIEKVPNDGRGVGFHQCYRKRGFGEDGLYCGIHAKRHPDPNKAVEERFLYFAKVEYEEPLLAKVRIAEEGKKTIRVSVVENLIGDTHIYDRYNKPCPYLFKNLSDAAYALEQRIVELRKRYEDGIKRLDNVSEQIATDIIGG